MMAQLPIIHRLHILPQILTQIMLIKLSKLATSAFSTNLGLKCFKDAAALQQLSSSTATNPQTKQKLDALTNVIYSLSNIEIQYLVALQNQQCLNKGLPISNQSVISLGDEKLTTIEYLYQKRWIQEVWKDYHILTSLFSDEGDNEGVQEVAQAVKEIYEFELTSVDASQKIKIIKVIRELLNLGLKEAKDIVDKAPIIMKKGKKEQGEKLKEELAKSGCVVTLK